MQGEDRDDPAGAPLVVPEARAQRREAAPGLVAGGARELLGANRHGSVLRSLDDHFRVSAQVVTPPGILGCASLRRGDQPRVGVVVDGSDGSDAGRARLRPDVMEEDEAASEAARGDLSAVSAELVDDLLVPVRETIAHEGHHRTLRPSTESPSTWPAPEP